MGYWKFVEIRVRLPLIYSYPHFTIIICFRSNLIKLRNGYIDLSVPEFWLQMQEPHLSKKNLQANTAIKENMLRALSDAKLSTPSNGTCPRLTKFIIYLSLCCWDCSVCSDILNIVNGRCSVMKQSNIEKEISDHSVEQLFVQNIIPKLFCRNSRA